MSINCRLYVYASVEEGTWVEEQAREHDMSVSSYIRAALLDLQKKKRFNPKAILAKKLKEEE